MLTDTYPDPLQLPFNRSAMHGFNLAAPDLDPGGEGIVLAMQGTRGLTVAETPVRLPRTGELPLIEPADSALYFGDWHGTPCRTLLLPNDFVAGDGFHLTNLLAAEPQLDTAALSLSGLAAQVLHWHRQSSTCGYCGGTCGYIAGEWGRICSACQKQRYPAIHPCVIVLISRPGELLLVRKPEWAEQRYSLVAGFVEFGESLEECVVREVAEEVGVQVRNLRYAGSQSWPFPSQLMAGYFAEYVSGEIRLDRTELADGHWFTLDDLPSLPPPRSIARWLIDQWCEEQRGHKR